MQFTPDLLPADIIGSEVLEEGADRSRAFRFIKGPIFAQLLMADEINRASPRTQSALLQAMQEHHVSVAGKRYDLPRPFHVLATQNPLEQEGTYPLPEAQLDRFLLQIDVHYPDRESERRVLLETTGETGAEPIQALDARICWRRSVSCGACRSATRWWTRSSTSCAPRGRASGDPTIAPHVAWGPGPRAAQALMLATRARALIDGPPRAVARRRGGARRAGAAPPHGAEFRRPPRDERCGCDRKTGVADRVTLVENRGASFLSLPGQRVSFETDRLMQSGQPGFADNADAAQSLPFTGRVASPKGGVGRGHPQQRCRGANPTRRASRATLPVKGRDEGAEIAESPEGLMGLERSPSPRGGGGLRRGLSP